MILICDNFHNFLNPEQNAKKPRHSCKSNHFYSIIDTLNFQSILVVIKNSVEEFKKTVNRQSLVQGNDVPVHSSTVVLVLVYHDEISQVISLISPKIIDLPSLIQ